MQECLPSRKCHDSSDAFRLRIPVALCFAEESVGFRVIESRSVEQTIVQFKLCRRVPWGRTENEHA